MKILILGGRRYLGPRLVKRLLDCGHKPVLLHRGRTNAPLPVTTPVREIQGDRNDEAELAALLTRESFDAVVDTLAFSAADAELAVRVFAGKVQRYLVISSVACYGRLLCVPADEDHPYIDETRAFPGAANAYATGKRDVERVLLAAHRNGSLPVTIIRPSVGYGYGRLFSIWGYSNRHVARIRAGKPVVVPDTGESLIQPIFVDDEAAIIERALVTGEAAGEALNCAGPVAVPLWQYFCAHGAAMGCSVGFVELPATYLHGFDPVLCARASQNLVFNHAYDVSKLHRLFDFEHQYSLEDGLKHTIDFLDRWRLIEPTTDGDPDDWLIEGYRCLGSSEPRRLGEQLRADKGYQPLPKQPLVKWAPDRYEPPG